MDLNSSPSPFPIEEISQDHDNHQKPNFGVASSLSSVSCHLFLNSAQDQDGYHHQQFYNPHNLQEGEDYYSFHGGSSSREIKNKVENTGLKLTLWKKEDHGPESVVPEQNINNSNNNNNPVKWMSSKMRLMRKMNNPPDRVSLNIITTNIGAATTKYENDPSSSTENELSSNSTSYNCNSPIRVCADCNTTKTPLWRSGPKGPKSLCNACGIRQRKARRAMAAAAAAANGTMLSTDQPPTLKIKVQHKEKTPKNGHASHLKKRLKTVSTQAPSGSHANEQRKLGLEDFLINLSKSLNFHRVFPEDERDAAILLMALSSGLVHG